MLGYGIVLPSLVYIVQKFHGSNFLYGALGASYSACQFIGAPVLGKLSDRFGRKKMLFICVLGSAIAWALFLVALHMQIEDMGSFKTNMTGVVAISLPMICIFIARSVDGLTAGDVSVANAYVADITTQEERKADFGKMGVAGNLGFILGPALAGVLAATPLGLDLPVIVALGTSIIGLLLIIFSLQESRAKQKDSEAEKQHLSFANALRLNQILLLLLIYFTFFLAFSLFVAGMPLYATESLHWSVAETGIFFSVLSIVIVLTEGPILSFFNNRTSAESLTIWGTFIVVLSYLSLLVPSPIFAYAAAVLYALGNGLMWPSFLSILSDRAGEEHQGYIQGLGNSAGSLASIGGLLFGGIIFTVMKGTMFIVPAILVFVVFLMCFLLKGKTKVQEAGR